MTSFNLDAAKMKEYKVGYNQSSEALKYIRKNNFGDLMPLEILRGFVEGTLEIKKYEDLMVIDAISRVANSQRETTRNKQTIIQSIVFDVIEYEANGEDVLL